MANENALARLVDLVPYIATHQGISIEDLATVFNVSRKQIESDLWTLFMCGLPGYTPLDLMEIDFEDGFVTIRNAKELSKVRKLSKLEIITLLVGIDALQATTQDSDLTKLQIKLSKLMGFERDLRPEMDFAEVFKAIADNEVLEIKYLLIDKDQVSEREIIPLELYQDHGHSYLKAFCLLSNSARTFRMDRIIDIKHTGRSDLSHIPDEVSTEPGIAMVNIHSQQRAVSEYFAIAKPSTGQVQINFFNAEWLTRSVLSFGGAVEVLLSSDLRSEIRAKAVQTRALYN